MIVIAASWTVEKYYPIFQTCWNIIYKLVHIYPAYQLKSLQRREQHNIYIHVIISQKISQIGTANISAHICHIFGKLGHRVCVTLSSTFSKKCSTTCSACSPNLGASRCHDPWSDTDPYGSVSCRSYKTNNDKHLKTIGNREMIRISESIPISSTSSPSGVASSRLGWAPRLLGLSGQAFGAFLGPSDVALILRLRLTGLRIAEMQGGSPK